MTFVIFLSGLVLLGGLIFFYMKYKSLQKHYSQMGDQYHEDDEMKVVYHGEMEAGNTTENLFVSVWGYVTLGSKNFKCVAFLLRRSWVRPSRAEDVPACGLHRSIHSQARRNPLEHRIGLGLLPVFRMDFFAAQSDKVRTATPR